MFNSDSRGKRKKDMNDLALTETYVPDVPKDIIFPDELNAYLRDQIQCLTHENGMLERNLSETETKLRNETTQVQVLSKQIKQYENASPSNSYSSVSSIASAKIVELSKKLREKTSELESVKTKSSKLEHQLFMLQTKEENVSPQLEKEAATPAKFNTEQEDEIKQLNDKVGSVSSKLFESKNVNIQLKNDLKLANKLLQQEVGDNFETLQNLANNGCHWRGRAQIICDLQQKNHELRDKLRQLQDKKSDVKFVDPVNIKCDRRLEILSRENISLKNDCQELKKKLDGSRARSRALESENSVLKTKVLMLSEQQENNKDIITTLTGQLSTFKNMQNDDLKQKDQMIMKLQREFKNQQTVLSKEQCRYDHMKQELEEKLSGAINARHEKFSRPVAGRTTIANDDKLVSRLEAERMRLLELTDLTNKRLENERKSLAEIQMHYKAERQKNAKLEAKIARLELDNSGRQSTYTLISSRSKEDEVCLKDKLELAEENVKALKTRLEMEQSERELDFKEFSEILRNYAPNEQNLS